MRVRGPIAEVSGELLGSYWGLPHCILESVNRTNGVRDDHDREDQLSLFWRCAGPCGL
jgi:hypothetical protein